SREQRLRHYVASFGIELAPRTDGEREQTETSIANALDRLVGEKKRPSIVHVWGPAPSAKSTIPNAVRRLRTRHVEVRWTLPNFEDGVRAALQTADRAGSEPEPPIATLVEAVESAVLMRARSARVRGERTIRQMGATVYTRERRT